jgi:hypothetical protein
MWTLDAKVAYLMVVFSTTPLFTEQLKKELLDFHRMLHILTTTFLVPLRWLEMKHFRYALTL